MYRAIASAIACRYAVHVRSRLAESIGGAWQKVHASSGVLPRARSHRTQRLESTHHAQVAPWRSASTVPIVSVLAFAVGAPPAGLLSTIHASGSPHGHAGIEPPQIWRQADSTESLRSSTPGCVIAAARAASQLASLEKLLKRETSPAGAGCPNHIDGVTQLPKIDGHAACGVAAQLAGSGD